MKKILEEMKANPLSVISDFHWEKQAEKHNKDTSKSFVVIPWLNKPFRLHLLMVFTFEILGKMLANPLCFFQDFN